MKAFAVERVFFPDPRVALRDGLVLVSDELSVSTLLEAYSFGIFPWPQEDLPVLWFSPDPRGILDFKDFHCSRSFKKFLKKTQLQITFDVAFEQVVQECSQVPRPNQSGTWITSEILKTYGEFHRAGYAHSVECWDGDLLVGGLYGVLVGGVFAGESMFYKSDGASKFCFYSLVEKLKSMGMEWMDLQMITPVTEQFGGRYISRSEFLNRLEVSKKNFKNLEIWEIETNQD